MGKLREVVRLTAGDFVWREIDRVVPAGTTDPLDIFEPLGVALDGRLAAFMERWQRARAAYNERRFAEAGRLFAQAADLRPEDGPCRVFIERCRELAITGLQPDWDGVWHFQQK